MNQGQAEAYRVLSEMVQGFAGTDDSFLAFRASPLSELPLELFWLGQLEGLELDSNELTTLPPTIRELTRLLRINLSSNKLTEIPAEFGELSSLLRAELGDNLLTTLPPGFGKLARLEYLRLSGNRLAALPKEFGLLRRLGYLDLSDNRLADLPVAFGRLSSLDVLDLSKNRLQALPTQFGELENLDYLNLSNNKLATLPTQFGQLTKLRRLDLSDNALRAIPSELGRLNALSSLDLSRNQLSSLPGEIGQLTSLKFLDLSDNQLTTLPPRLGHLSDRVDLRLSGNPLAEPVPELLERGVPELLAYLRSVLDAGQAQYEAKLVLVGEGNVGKTSLVAALNDEPFVANRATTHGIKVGQLRLPHPTLRAELLLNTWDFGGQEVYRITHQFFFSRRCLYLLVWRPREGQEENAIDAWCRRIRLRVGGQARILIVATHADEGRRPELDYPYLKRQFGEMVVGHYSVDSESGAGLKELREAIAEQAAQLPQMGELISRRWIAVRDELKSLPNPQMPYHELSDVCERHGLDTKQTATFAGLLHDLGHIIHYAEDNGLRDIVVLQPEWLTRAIGYVLEDDITAEHGGVLDHHRLAGIWQDPKREVQYPLEHHRYFLRLMEKFDVSYRIFELDEDKSLIAQLVPYDEPTLPWHGETPLQEGVRQLSAVCEMAEVAPGLLAWLTVRNHRFSTGRHWRRGVFLEHPRQEAQGLFMLQSEGRLELRVRAPSPDYFFSVMRDSLEDLISRRWEGLEYDLLIPCTGAQPDGGHCSGQFRLETLQGYRERGRLEIDCHRCYEPQDIMKLLTGFARLDTPLERVLAEFQERSEELKTEVRDAAAELRADQRRSLAAHAADVANQFRILLRVVGAEMPDCPRLFTLVPREANGHRVSELWQNDFQLTLWCEQPGNEHPWPAAKYTFHRPKQWFSTLAPYLLVVSRLLRTAVPIAGAAISVALDEEELKRIDKELELMKALVEQLPEGDLASLPAIHEIGSRVEGADLRALRALLVEVDPFMRFGGLRRVLAPSGDYLWICSTPEHLREYDPGLPRLAG